MTATTTALSWQPSGRGTSRAFQLLEDGQPIPGVIVRHCGHPTALRPWYAENIPGTAFQYVADARAFSLVRHTGGAWPKPEGMVARNTASPISNREARQWIL